MMGINAPAQPQPLRVAQRVSCTPAEGPFVRAALWVAGCSIRCPGCCNPELFSKDAGQPLSLPELQHWTQSAQRNHGVEGVSVLGGEPLEQPEPLFEWLSWVRDQGLGVVLFSGFRWGWLSKQARFSGLRDCVDTLVDGPFVQSRLEPRPGRAVVGSTNQTLHHFSSRYATSSLWQGPSRAKVEVQDDGLVQIHGSPALVSRIKAKLDRSSSPKGSTQPS